MSRLRLICLLGVLCFPFTVGNAQSYQLDSLRNIIRSSVNRDTSYVLQLCEFAYAFDDISYDSMIVNAHRAYVLSNALRYDKGKGYALWLKGIAHYYQSHIDSAQYHLQKALPFALASNYLLGQGRIYNSLANVLSYKGDGPNALEYYFRSLQIKQTIGDAIGQSITLNNIANIYSEQGERARAANYYRKSLEIRRSINREHQASMLLSTMAENYIYLGLLDSANYFLRRAQNFVRPNNEPLQYVHVVYAFASYYQALHQYDSALYFAKLGIDIAKQAGSTDREVLFYLKNSQLLNITRQHEAALKMASLALQNSEKPMRLDYRLEYEHHSSDAYYGLGRYKEAYESFERYKTLNDSVKNKSYRNSLLVRELEYQLQSEKLKSDADRAAFEQKENRTKIILWLIASIALGVAGIAFLFYRMMQVRTIANKKLEASQLLIEQQNREIQSQNEELRQQGEEILSINEKLEEEVLKRTRELHETIKRLTEQNEGLEQFSYITSHNLRAPLARIAGLVTLIKLTKQSSPELINLIDLLETTSKEFDEIIYDLTQIVTIKKGVDFNREAIDLKEFVQSVLLFFESDFTNTKSRVQVNIKVEEPVYTIRPFLHSVLINLISNSLKYRSLDRPLVITIEATLENQICCFKVQDNGVGIDLNETNSKKIFGLYNRFHPKIEGKGFGLYLVKTQLILMGGDISVSSELNKGSEFSFYFPINRT